MTAGLSGATKPTATGNLVSTPFCELLVYALGQSLAGSLVLECPDRSKHALTFEQGAAVKARVSVHELRLGELLVARGAIDASAQRAAESAAPGTLYGERLIEAGALTADALALALDDQLYQQIGWLARAPGATAFAYYAGTDLLASWGGEPRKLDPLAAIWQAVQGSAPKERIALACQGIADRTLRLHPASRVGRFGFGSRERAVLDVLRVKPQTVAELRATGLLEPSVLDRLLYVLTLTRHLDTGELPLGVVAGTRPIPAQSAPRRALSSAQRPIAVPPVAAAADAPPEAAAAEAPAPARRELAQTGRFATRQEIEAKHQALEQQNHYELLDVERSATGEQIASAFAALVRRWHPDRLSPDLADLKEVSMRVFARMTEAYRTLGHPGSRQEYDQSLGGAGGDEAGEDEQAQVLRVLRAAESFQKAEILMRKRDLDGAERFAAAAVAGDKDQPEYAALYAWIRARKPGVSEADIGASLDVLKGAVSKQGNNVKIRYYLGCVLKLAGQENSALREFKFVADNDPSNLDAARELRLHELRKQGSGSPSGEGLFGRLFKR